MQRASAIASTHDYALSNFAWVKELDFGFDGFGLSPTFIFLVLIPKLVAASLATMMASALVFRIAV